MRAPKTAVSGQMREIEIITQILGIIALSCSFIIYQQKTRKRLLSFKMLQDVSWCLHYLLLGAYSASATSAICTTRSIVYFNNDKKFFKSRIWLFLYVGLYVASAILTWQSIFSIFPATSSIISTFGFWLKNPKHTKILAIFASTCSLIYNITVAHSPSVYIAVAFSIISAIISIVRTTVSEKKLKNTK